MQNIARQLRRRFLRKGRSEGGGVSSAIRNRLNDEPLRKKIKQVAERFLNFHGLAYLDGAKDGLQDAVGRFNHLVARCLSLGIKHGGNRANRAAIVNESA
jgi:hypothetical protein